VFIAALALAVLGAVLCIAGIAALFRGRPLGFVLRTLAGLFLIALGSLAGVMAMGLRGYQALTHEEVAAQITIEPTGTQRHRATVRFPDGREAAYDIAGDDIYVDAQIIKWHPWANMLGFHTAYQLERIAGRYRQIEQERNAPRTVYPLGRVELIDLVELHRRYPVLGRLFDAQYGSAAFVPAAAPAQLEVRVSTSGLLIRPAEQAAAPAATASAPSAPSAPPALPMPAPAGSAPR
jgi:hypothetical protein